MERTARPSVWLFLIFCLLWGISAPAGAEELAGFASKELLDHAGLEMAWQVTLPLLDKENIDTMLLLEDRLYVRSTRNYVWSMERNTGKTVFARSIAQRDMTILGFSLYEDRLITVINNQIVEIDKNTGVQQRADDPGIGIVAPVARNSEYFYVPAGDHRLHVFKAKGMVYVFNAGVANEPMITSVLADDDRVVLGTESGSLMGMATDMPKKLWQFDASDALVGPVVRDANSFFFASRDTNVYRIDQTDSTEIRFVWRYQTEAFLDRGPNVTSDTVYQYALNRGFDAIDKQRGTALWVLPEGLDLLAQAGRQAYILTKSKTLSVMDNPTGKRIYSANVGTIANHATNVMDGKIYVADDRGHVVCLQPQK